MNTFTPLPAPIPIADQKWPEGTLPLVTTRTMVFNHESFIRDCLNGILMQKTTFPVQVLIHDDVSTDNSIQILREYEKKYPGIITVYYQEKNTFSLPNKHELRADFFQLIRGKYTALCEGDDYWTDPMKLQKQVSFLEENSDYVLTCGGYKVVNQETNHSQDVIDNGGTTLTEQKWHGFSFDLNDFGNKWITKTLTVVYKTASIDLNILNRYKTRKDTHLYYHILKNGKGFYFTQILGVYNAHEGGIFSLNSKKNRNNSNYLSFKELYDLNRDEFTREYYLYQLTGKFGFEFWRNIRAFKINLKEVKEIIKLTSSGKELNKVIKILIVEIFNYKPGK